MFVLGPPNQALHLTASRTTWYSMLRYTRARDKGALTLAGFGRFGILVYFYVDEIEYMFYNLVKENYGPSGR